MIIEFKILFTLFVLCFGFIFALLYNQDNNTGMSNIIPKYHWKFIDKIITKILVSFVILIFINFIFIIWRIF